MESCEYTQDEQDLLAQARKKARETVELQAQTPEELHRLRTGYSFLLHTLKEHKTELVQDRQASGKLVELIDQANELHTHVHRTVDATLDARFMAASAEIGAERMHKLPVQGQTFTLSDFSVLLAQMMARGRSDEMGVSAASHWLGVAGMATAMHCFQDNPNALVKRKPREPRAAPSGGSDPLARPAVLSADQLSAAAQQETTDLVIHVWEQLQTLLSAHALPLYQVVCHPQSYSRSVEQLFYCSFLISDNRLFLEKDENGELCIGLLKAQPDAGRKRHCVVSMSMKEWRENCARHKLSEPLIKL